MKLVSKTLFLLLLISCSSAAKDWGPWTRCGVAEDAMVWDFCTEVLHGPDTHHKGICGDTLECRSRKTILGNTRTEQRIKRLFCAWGDIECMQKNKLFNKVIKNN